MRLQMICKDKNSNPDGCPSIYLAENGMCAVQGELMDPDTAANMQNVLPGEGGVMIKPEVVIEAAAWLQARGCR